MRASRYVFPLLLATSALATPNFAFAQVAIGVSVEIAPPALPVYVQPEIPAPGYIWTPGYWAYNADGYYWVPGTWVQPPSVGLLWTPGYWGWNNGAYIFNSGYWGPTVGFYGGINYGFGYGGFGYDGGYWNHGEFSYNRAVNNFGNTHIANVYDRAVVNNNHSTVGFNGGHGGVDVRPTAQQEAYAHEHHVGATPAQTAHVEAARGEPSLRASANHGNPAVAATSRPGELRGAGVVAARGATPAGEHPEAAVRPNEPAHTEAARPAANAEHPEAAVRPNEPARAEVAHPAAAHPEAAARPAAAQRPAVAHAAPKAAPRPAVAHAAPHAAPRPVAHAAPARPAPRPVAHAAPHPAPRPVAHAAPAPHEDVKRPG